MKLIINYLLLIFASLLYLPKGKAQEYTCQPVPFTEVKLNDRFWLPRIETNRNVTIPYAFAKCEETGRIDNFAKAAGKMDGPFGTRYPFDDTDVYKIIEGASYSLQVIPDASLESYMDSLIDLIAAAREEDGYLYTARTIDPGNPHEMAGKERWSNLGISHELFNVGQLNEAGIAYYQATGKRKLLDAAIQFADLVCREFGPGKRYGIPGHQEIELALAKLYRVTGDRKYLELARFFIEQRGDHTHREPLRILADPEYYQDHKPVFEQEEAVGHAVRAGYFYSAITDVAALSGDERYLKTTDRIWNDVVGTKLYLTGGIGSQKEVEGFGKPYELPNKTAYCETCAAIANIFWNYRLFLLHGDSKYIDVLERTLYNGFLSGISLSGKEFFYPNPLECDSEYYVYHSTARQPWFNCSCCPTSVVRFMPAIPGYIYAKTENALYVNLFVGSSAKAEFGQKSVQVLQETNYPWDGKIKISIDPEDQAKFLLKVRIPGWAKGKPVPTDLYQYMDQTGCPYLLRINGKNIVAQDQQGYMVIDRLWKKGDRVEVEFPMPVQKVISHPMVSENNGKIALERGPLVYCAESIDNNGAVLNMLIPETTNFNVSFQGDLLNGVSVIRGMVSTVQEQAPVQLKSITFTAIPYYAWANRGSGEMRVWFPVLKAEKK
jgi:DUF1680 family protein